MSNIYFISDTHFGHNNIIKYCNRPFNDITEMENTIVANWNKIVTKHDKIYHLGDFSMCLRKSEVQRIYSRLNGKKALIQGNHDTLGYNFYHDLFDEYYKYPIILEKHWILSHEPLFVNDNMPYVNVHGHLHNGGHEDEFNVGKHHINVSIECINYEPISFNFIKNIYNNEN
jgi:calcineurin-like phosphoesterase family protein